MHQYLSSTVARPGAFAANFTPDTLNRFRDLCKQQGKQYTKVLERLAEVYLETGGAVLDGVVPSVPAPDTKKRQVQVESLQNKLLEDLLDATYSAAKLLLANSRRRPSNRWPLQKPR